MPAPHVFSAPSVGASPGRRSARPSGLPGRSNGSGDDVEGFPDGAGACRTTATPPRALRRLSPLRRSSNGWCPWYPIGVVFLFSCGVRGQLPPLTARRGTPLRLTRTPPLRVRASRERSAMRTGSSLLPVRRASRLCHEAWLMPLDLCQYRPRQCRPGLAAGAEAPGGAGPGDVQAVVASCRPRSVSVFAVASTELTHRRPADCPDESTIAGHPRPRWMNLRRKRTRANSGRIALLCIPWP